MENENGISWEDIFGKKSTWTGPVSGDLTVETGDILDPAEGPVKNDMDTNSQTANNRPPEVKINQGQ